MVSRISSLLAGLASLMLVACSEKPAPDRAFAGAAQRTVRCEDGLVVKTIREGQGAAASYADQVKVHYIARVLGGQELSRSHDRSPSYVVVGRKGELVRGLHRGLMGMRVGELRKIEVPKDLGYRGQKVPGLPPEAVLEFWVEMFALSPASTPQAAPAEICPSA